MNSTSLYNPVQTSQMPALQKVKARIWAVVNSTIFRYSPWFARSFRRFLLSLFGCIIASDASIGRKARIDYPWNLEIGSLSSIGSDSWIYALDKIKIGQKTCIGDEVKLITGSHEINQNDFALITKPISIADACWIGTSATVLPGILIGDGAVVAACAVVTKDVEPWTVVGGNPARLIKKREIK
jgi:putative colanic acid biosynthesis acetyltransferase WcaF